MARKTPNFFIDAFYESKFKDSLFVIKAGGKIIEDQKILDNLLSNIRELTMHGIKVLLIYGFGRAVDEALEKSGVAVNKVEGRRVTDAPTLQIIQNIVGGTLSTNIASSMARNDMEGLSLGTVPANWMRVEPRAKKPVDYGFVGDVKNVEGRPISRLFKTVDFIACSCLAAAQDGQIYNINADTIATELAVGLKANKLIFLSDVDGVQIEGKTAEIITADEIPALISKGIATGGMKVKLENCLAALKGGVRRIHLISGLRQDALKNEIYQSFGPGTMLFNEGERKSYENEIEAQKVIERQTKRV